MKSSSKPFIFLLACVVMIFTFSESEGNQNEKARNATAVFRSIQTDQGPMVEIKVGNLVMMTSRLTLNSKILPDCIVRSVNGKVEMRSKNSVSQAELIELAIWQ